MQLKSLNIWFLLSAALAGGTEDLAIFYKHFAGELKEKEVGLKTHTGRASPDWANNKHNLSKGKVIVYKSANHLNEMNSIGVRD